jgi:uncharacterized protein YndB with AHSA1/START domain
MQDIIERSIIVKVRPERVYTAISDPTQIITWFPDSVDGSLVVGEQSTFDFGEDGKAQVAVVGATPFSYFAFRWYTDKGVVENVLTAQNTLVEFHIEELADGTKVTVKESGFASLPVEVAEKSFNDNTGGWKYMIGRLEEALSKN